MRVLVIGSGAREHALCLAAAADPQLTHLICAPGNAGIAGVAECRPVDVTDPTAIADLAENVAADLVVIGPEAPLATGAADAVRARGIDCFGPSAGAARIEASKSFAKDVMAAASVPTAAAVTCTTPDEVAAALDRFDPPYVVKADGLGAGKGVVVTDDRAAALAHAERSGTVVVEEYLDGPEISVFCLVDGTTVVPLAPAQDFKRIGDGDTGPNTGGMGAYCPVPWAPDTLVDDVIDRIVRPTVTELDRRGTPFSGLLYTGLALTGRGPAVVEFNARFGDPETQVVLAMLDTPVLGPLRAVATGALADAPPLRWRTGAAVTVVIAAAGYPGTPRTGDVIAGSDTAGVLHAGTRLREDGAVVSSGGRVLSVVGTAATLAGARTEAYRIAAGIILPDGQYRTDIAARAANGEVVVPTVS